MTCSCNKANLDFSCCSNLPNHTNAIYIYHGKAYSEPVEDEKYYIGTVTFKDGRYIVEPKIQVK